jgi:hypothetical protein
MAAEEELERSALERGELEAVLEARRELGPSYDAALVESFAERIEAAVVARTAQEASVRDRDARERASAGPRQLALGIVSVVAGIPVTALSLAVPENAAVNLGSLVLGWGGIVAVNFAHALQARGRAVSR